jgi:hypothetical protein
MPTKTRIDAKTKVTTFAPLLPVALATHQYHVAALCIICAGLETIAEQERANVTPAQA